MKMKDIMTQYHVSRKALLIYEDKNLIHPKRDQSGYRIYNDKDIQMIQRIILLRKMEFSLDEIENIIIHKQRDVIHNKKEQYNKDIHFINTKKNYLNYIDNVLHDDFDIDEAINAVDETMELYESNQYDDMIHFEYHRDTLILMWFACFIISILSMQIPLIIASVICGILSIVLSLQSVRKLFLSLPMKRIMGILMMIICLLTFIIVVPQEDNFTHNLLSALSFSYFFFSFGLFSKVRTFLRKYQNLISLFFFLIGIGVMILGFTYMPEGNIGLTIFLFAVESLILGIAYNTWLRKLFLYLIENLI